MATATAFVTKAPTFKLTIPASHVDNALQSARDARAINYWGRFWYDDEDACWYVSEESSGDVWGLTPWAIEDGLIVMASLAPLEFGKLLADKTDANTGDILIQCIALGELRYG